MVGWLGGWAGWLVGVWVNVKPGLRDSWVQVKKIAEDEKVEALESQSKN